MSELTERPEKTESPKMEHPEKTAGSSEDDARPPQETLPTEAVQGELSDSAKTGKAEGPQIGKTEGAPDSENSSPADESGEQGETARNGKGSQPESWSARIIRPIRNALRLFADDVHRLGGNVITILTVLGLVVLPSLFSWYNILACWDVFENTGGLTVAVANSDEGYSSDLIPLQVNIGKKVEDALRANDQLNWVFTDEEDAVDGARAGRYYAAVVIPSSFSADMLSFYSKDVEHARILYYSNQKKSAIAPKVTDQGADRVSSQVNQVFTETISEIALGISSTLANYLNDPSTSSNVARVANRISQLADSMDESAELVMLYADMLGSAQSLIRDSDSLLSKTQSAIKATGNEVQGAGQSVGQVGSALRDSLDALSAALGKSSESFAAVPSSVDYAFDSTAQLASDSANALHDQANLAAAQAQDLRDLKGYLSKRVGSLPDDVAPSVERLIERIESIIELEDRVSESLMAAASGVQDKTEEAMQSRDEAKALAQEASESLDAAKRDYDENLKPSAETLIDSLGGTGESVANSLGRVEEASASLKDTPQSVADKLSDARGTLEDAAQMLGDSSTRLRKIAGGIDQALETGDVQALRDIIGNDPALLSSILSAPVRIERIAVYPVEHFGDAMAPLYTTLALWIGSLLIMVTLKVTPSEKHLRRLDRPTARQAFCGRFGMVALVSLMQSTTLALGNILFLGVQTNSIPLYLICFWGAGLVFAFIIYSLVFLFANLGKALGVILLIIQVSGGGGSFPMQLLPQFFQDVSRFLPLTHAVNAMRAAMFGVYNGDFWHEMAALVTFTLPLLLFALLFSGVLVKVIPSFIEKIERSKLV